MKPSGINMRIDLLIKDSASVILAMFVGIIFYRRITLVGKIFLFQAIIYLIIDTAVMNVRNNVWIYNLYIPVETVLLSYAAVLELNTKISKWVITSIFAAFLILYISELTSVNLTGDFVYISALTEYFFLTGLYSFIIFRCVNDGLQITHNLAILIVSAGIILYSAGSIPSLAAMKHLMNLDMLLSQVLFQRTVVLLAVLRYLSLAIGLYLIGKKVNNIQWHNNGQI